MTIGPPQKDIPIKHQTSPQFRYDWKTRDLYPKNQQINQIHVGIRYTCTLDRPTNPVVLTPSKRFPGRQGYQPCYLQALHRPLQVMQVPRLIGTFEWQKSDERICRGMVDSKDSDVYKLYRYLYSYLSCL